MTELAETAEKAETTDKVQTADKPETGDKAEKGELESLKRALRKEQLRLNIRKFAKNKLAVTGALLLVLMLAAALFAPLAAPQGPFEMVVANRLKPPGGEHLFGTDTFGRDLFSRVLYGARISLFIGAGVSLISFAFGLVMGLYAGYYKVMDNIIMRICDGLSAIPPILLAIAFMAVLGPSSLNVTISLAIVYTPGLARIVRSSALSVKEQTYVESMRALGASPTRIIWGHIAPNILGPVIVQASFIFANAIITEAALSFLGVGVPVPNPSWGNILYEGKTVIYNSWWMVVFPGVFTALSVLGLNLFGDGLRDILDPHTNG